MEHFITTALSTHKGFGGVRQYVACSCGFLALANPSTTEVILQHRLEVLEEALGIEVIVNK